jgi:hypothetical protein
VRARDARRRVMREELQTPQSPVPLTPTNMSPVDLISKWMAGMDNSRLQADSGAKYSLYFDLLGDKITHYSIDPRHTYNMDEKGFLTGITGRSRRVFSRKMWERKEVRAAIQDGSRECITV